MILEDAIDNEIEMYYRNGGAFPCYIAMGRILFEVARIRKEANEPDAKGNDICYKNVPVLLDTCRCLDTELIVLPGTGGKERDRRASMSTMN